MQNRIRGFSGKIRSEFSFIKGNYLLLLLGSLITDFSAEMAFTYFPLYFKLLGGTATTLGLVNSVFSVTSALVRFPGGYIADKYGRKAILWSMTMLTGFSFLFYIFAPSWEFILIGVTIRGLASIYMPAYSALTMDSVPPENRGTGFSIIHMITSASTTPSPLIAGFLYTTYGLMTGTRISYTIVVITFIIAAILRSRITETIENAETINSTKIIQSFTGANVFKEGLKVWMIVPRTVLALLGIQILFNLFNAMFNVVFIYYLIDEILVSPENLAVLFTVVSMSVIILAIPCGKLVDKYGKRNSMLFAYTLMAAAMPLLIWGNYYHVLLLAPIIALINIIYGASISSLYADLVPIEHRGKISGSSGFILLLVGSLGQILGGFLYDNVSHFLPLNLFWASTIPAFLLTFIFIKNPEKYEITGMA